MSTALQVAIYPGAAALPNQVTIRAHGLHGAPVSGSLRFLDSGGHAHPIAKAPSDQDGSARWVLTFEEGLEAEGPELVIPPWQGPTTPQHFHFQLEATAIDPATDTEEPVLVVVGDDDGPIRANDPDTGGPVANDAVEMAETLHLYLEA